MNNGFPNGFPNGYQNNGYQNNGYQGNNNYPYNGYPNNGYQDNGYPNQQNYQQYPEEALEEEGSSIFFTLAIVIILILFAMYFFKFGLFKEKEKFINAESISLNVNDAKLRIGESMDIKATIDPKDSTDFIAWSSSDKEIASVDSNGKVTGRKEGTVTITAKANDKVIASCTIKVISGEAIGDDGKINALEVFPSSITLNETKVEITVGEKFVFVPSLTPGNITNDSITWVSSDSSVVSIYNGEITAVKPGTSIISARTANGLTAEATVTVKDVQVTSISLDKTSESITVGGTVTLVPIITPDTAANQSLAWSTSDKGVAVVDGNGVVTGKKVGTATITVKSGNGKTATAKIKVVSTETPIESISLNATSKEMVIGETFLLKVTVLPEDATNKTVTWSSSDKTVATVSNGRVSARKVGTATITAKTKNGKTATFKVTITRIEVESVSIDKANILMSIGSTVTVNATVKPSDAEDKSITWSSSDNAVATVDSTGRIKGVKEGTAVITAKASSGVTDTVNVTVKKSPTISIDKESETICVGCSTTVTATVTDSTEKPSWKSSDTSVATVDQTGKVVGKKEGRANITASLSNGASVTFRVIVKGSEPTGLKLDKTSLTVNVGDAQKITATITPSNATDKSITWKSSNTSVATVVNGLVTGIKSGTATITAKTSNGIEATCTVTVRQVYPDNISIQSSLSLEVGATHKLTVTYSPSSILDKTVTWSSNASTVATVSSDGTVTAKSAGTARITAKTPNNKTDICTVTVTRPNLVFNYGSTYTLNVGSSITLRVMTASGDYYSNTVTWKSSNTSVASVTNGVVRGISAGTATITATASNGAVATIRITVPTSSGGGNSGSTATMLAINPSASSVHVGSSINVTATLGGCSGSCDFSFVWSSTSSICSVSNTTGKVVSVTGIRAGTCTIIAYEVKSGLTRNTMITVVN